MERRRQGDALAVGTDPAVLELEREIGLAPWAPDGEGPRTTVAVLSVAEVTGRWFPHRADEQERWFW